MTDIIDSVMEFSRESGLLDALDGVRRAPANPSPGRPIHYSNESMLRAVVLKFLQNERYAKDFIAFLEKSAQAQTICGFQDGYTPCEATDSRFNRMLSEHDDALWDTVAAAISPIDAQIAGGREMGEFADDAPSFGEILAIDSTSIESFSDAIRKRHIDDGVPKPDKPEECLSTLPNCCKPSDMNAAWGQKTDSKSKTGVSPFFGYKLHTVCDAYYGTPLHSVLLPANESDTKQLRPLIEETLERYPWLSPSHLLADKGYDSEANFVFLDSRDIIPIIAVRKPKKKKGHRRVTYEVEVEGPYGGYTQEVSADGYPICLGNRIMKFVRTDPERGHLFRCERGGCRLNRGQTLFPLDCEGEIWVKPEGKMLRIVGKIPRFSKLWELLYKLRQAIERFLGSGKRSRLLDTQRFLTKAKVEMHVVLSLLTYNATMLTRLTVGDYERMRHMRVKGR